MNHCLEQLISSAERSEQKRTFSRHAFHLEVKVEVILTIKSFRREE